MWCVMSSLAIFNLCCNAKLICCQFSRVYHQWNVYLINKTCCRLLYLKYYFRDFFSCVPTCLCRLVAVIFIDLFFCLVAFAFPPIDEQFWSISDFKIFFSLFSALEKNQYQLFVTPCCPCYFSLLHYLILVRLYQEVFHWRQAMAIWPWWFCSGASSFPWQKALWVL